MSFVYGPDELVADFLRSAPALSAWPWDPTRARDGERNRVMGFAEFPAHLRRAIRNHVGELFPRRRLLDQIRALICDGPAVLAWVGALAFVGDARFTRQQREVLVRLVDPLRRRLVLDRQLADARLGGASLAVLLEAIGSPAMIVSARGRVAHVNAAGRAALDRGQLRVELDDALRGRPTPIELMPIHGPGMLPHFLALARTRTPIDVVRAAGKRWRLTARQQQVLDLLVQGHANKTIASILGCAVHTVEKHVTAILDKVDATSRSELTARVWADAFSGGSNDE